VRKYLATSKFPMKESTISSWSYLPRMYGCSNIAAEIEWIWNQSSNGSKDTRESRNTGTNRARPMGSGDCLEDC